MNDRYNPAMTPSGGRMGGRNFPGKERKRSCYSANAPESDPNPVPQYDPSPFKTGVGDGGFLELVVFVVVCVLIFLVICMSCAAVGLVCGFLTNGSGDGSEKTSVVKFQVGLLGLGRSIQSNLNRIAEFADTSTPEGMSYVLTETTLALLRRPDYCISVYSFVEIKRSMEDGEKRFNQLSIEERMKFDEETLVNVNNIKMQSTTSQRASGFGNEYIVITILVAAEGVHELPTINGREDVKEALQKLGSIPSSKALAVEVLWTPQNKNSTLSKRELLQIYPLLSPLEK